MGVRHSEQIHFAFRVSHHAPPDGVSIPPARGAVGVKTTTGLFRVNGDTAKTQECKRRYERGEVMPLKVGADRCCSPHMGCH